MIRWDEELDAAVGTLWAPAATVDQWRLGDGLYLVVGTNKWDHELKVLDLNTGDVRLASYEPCQRPWDPKHKVVYYPFGRGLWELHQVRL